MAAIDLALLQVDRTPPGLLPVFDTLLYTNRLLGNLWGEAVVTAVSGVSAGIAVLEFTDLSGVTITSYGSDGPVPLKNVNSITFPSGSYWDIVLSDGTIIPDPNNGYDVSGNGNDAITINFTSSLTVQGTLHYNNFGYNRVVTDMIPADLGNIGSDVLGNPLEFPAVPQGLNISDCLIDYNLVPDNDLFNKNALEGNGLSLPEIWLSGTTWDYSVDPLIWTPTEKTMDYIYSRLTTAYRKIVFTATREVDSILIGITREQVFQAQLSDADASEVNNINNGTETLP